MKSGSLVSGIILTIFFVGLCICPVSAVSSETTVRGIVSDQDIANSTITINTTSGAITALVPDRIAFNIFWVGNHVTAVSSERSGGRWITLATTDDNRTGQYVAGYIVGDPNKLTTRIEGDYSVNITIMPDCNFCNDSICRASSAHILLKRHGTMVAEPVLHPDPDSSVPGKNCFNYRDPDDRSQVFISFISGETTEEQCTGIAPRGDSSPVQVLEVLYLPHFAIMEGYPVSGLPALVLILVLAGGLVLVGVLGVVHRGRNK
jgi:hypothetical protein